jgi:hypothetical protein
MGGHVLTYGGLILTYGGPKNGVIPNSDLTVDGMQVRI